ncbi:MAG: RcpC/CpaB family pilus assembly protein [Acidimicrobiales bacterium]
MVGGLLVAVAAVGTFAAYSGATADHRVDYVVASRTLTVGQRLGLGDLTVAPMNLPRQMATRWAFRNPASLVGALVVGPMAGGELIQASDVVAGTTGPSNEQMSFALPDANAVGGALKPGDHVAVLATFGTGTQAKTVEVLADTPLLAQRAGSSSLGSASAGSETVTVGISSPSQALALAHAVSAGTVMLVRVTGAGAGAGAAPVTGAGSGGGAAPVTGAGSGGGSGSG